MSQRTFGYFTTLIGLVCVGVIVRWSLAPASLTLRSALLQGVLVGWGLAVVTVEVLGRIKASRSNGWITIYGCGEPGNGMFLRAACARVFIGPVNSPQEAVYWKTEVDGEGHSLSGKHNYILRFPPNGLPRVDAFWSLTMADAKEHFVDNPIRRYCVSDRSGLLPNEDGSVEIFLQNLPPSGHESNWLPAPHGDFRLWLRAYMPGTAILDRTYVVPPVVQVR